MDPVPSGEEHHFLNRKIMDLATSLARVEGSELHVLHAWVPISESIWNAGRRLNPDDMKIRVHEGEKAHEQWFNELIATSPLEDLNVRLHLLQGDAGHLIPSVAQKEHIDVIVMGTVCRTGVAGLFIGNTAEKVLRHVDCSVLTVKPDGFATPVTLS